MKEFICVIIVINTVTNILKTMTVVQKGFPFDIEFKSPLIFWSKRLFNLGLIMWGLYAIGILQ